jgi:hypothetical protein
MGPSTWHYFAWCPQHISAWEMWLYPENPGHHGLQDTQDQTLLQDSQHGKQGGPPDPWDVCVFGEGALVWDSRSFLTLPLPSYVTFST